MPTPRNVGRSGKWSSLPLPPALPLRLGLRLFVFVGREFRIRQTLADDLYNQRVKAVRNVDVIPVVKTKRLFIDMPEQVKRLNAHMGAIQPALQQAPKF